MLNSSDWDHGYSFRGYNSSTLSLTQLAEDINNNGMLPLNKERYAAQNAVSNFAHDIEIVNGSRWVKLGICIDQKRIWLNADQSYISNGRPGNEMAPINRYITNLYYLRAMRNWFYDDRWGEKEQWVNIFTKKG